MRRRGNNPLLSRIILASVGVHVVALPILAHFGALKKIQEHFVEAKLIMLPTPEQIKPELAKPKQIAHKAHSVARRGRNSLSHSHANRTLANHPHIAMAEGQDGTDDGADQGMGRVGEVPNEGGTKTSIAVPQPELNGPDKEAVKPTHPVVLIQKPEVPAPPKVDPTPKPERPHEAILIDAEPIEGQQPKPVIPESLREDFLNATAVIELTVGAEGAASGVRISQSSGNRELDKLALDSAKHWKFKPASRDGSPVESRVRLHIEFQVD